MRGLNKKAPHGSFANLLQFFASFHSIAWRRPGVCGVKAREARVIYDRYTGSGNSAIVESAPTAFLVSYNHCHRKGLGEDPCLGRRDV